MAIIYHNNTHTGSRRKYSIRTYHYCGQYISNQKLPIRAWWYVNRLPITRRHFQWDRNLSHPLKIWHARSIFFPSVSSIPPTHFLFAYQTIIHIKGIRLKEANLVKTSVFVSVPWNGVWRNLFQLYFRQLIRSRVSLRNFVSIKHRGWDTLQNSTSSATVTITYKACRKVSFFEAQDLRLSLCAF